MLGAANTRHRAETGAHPNLHNVRVAGAQPLVEQLLQASGRCALLSFAVPISEDQYRLGAGLRLECPWADAHTALKVLRKLSLRGAALTRVMAWLEKPSPRPINLMATCSPERVSMASCTKPEEPLRWKE